MNDNELPQSHPSYKRDLIIAYIVLGVLVFVAIGALIWRMW